MALTNSVSLDSYFSEKIKDNNGNMVTDINAGLINLFANLNDYREKMTETQNYLVVDYEEGYPDLVAKNSVLADQAYWWWVLVINKLEDPFTELKANWIYSIVPKDQLEAFMNYTITVNTSSTNNRLGSVVELNP